MMFIKAINADWSDSLFRVMWIKREHRDETLIVPVPVNIGAVPQTSCLCYQLQEQEWINHFKIYQILISQSLQAEHSYLRYDST